MKLQAEIHFEFPFNDEEIKKLNELSHEEVAKYMEICRDDIKKLLENEYESKNTLVTIRLF